MAQRATKARMDRDLAAIAHQLGFTVGFGPGEAHIQRWSPGDGWTRHQLTIGGHDVGRVMTAREMECALDFAESLLFRIRSRSRVEDFSYTRASDSPEDMP